MTKKLLMSSVLVLTAITLSIGLTPIAEAWLGHDAWDKVDVTVPTTGSSSHSHTESSCSVVTKIEAGDTNVISWTAPTTCNGETFDRGRAMLYINDEYVKYYLFDSTEYDDSWSHGESVVTGDDVEAFNLYYYE